VVAGLHAVYADLGMQQESLADLPVSQTLTPETLSGASKALVPPPAPSRV
jgi:hypothetical protein